MSHSLRNLEGSLQRVVIVTTEEIETEKTDCLGLYAFRNEAGEKFMWSPNSFRYEFHDVETVAEADQVQFLCPLCFDKNGGSVGTHGVFVTFAGRNVPDEAGSRNDKGQPSRWHASGTTISDLVLSPSILLGHGCCWHGFVGMSGIPPGHAG